MIRKIIWGTLLVGLIGILVVGAVIRTADKTEDVAEARNQGYGRGHGEASEHAAELSDQGLGANAQPDGREGKGQPGGQGQGAGNAERQYPNNQVPTTDWVVYEGTVVQPQEDGADLVIRTAEGEEVKVGTGPEYMESQGFSLETGEQVQVQGYWEDDELKAAQVTRMRDGQTITLRDEAGRPAWAGSGKRGGEQQATSAQQGSQGQGGQGQGGQGQGGQGRGAQDQGGRGQGGLGKGDSGGVGQENSPGGGSGAGEAAVKEWLAVYGTAVSVDENALIVQTTDGAQITVEGRAWRFALEQGFWAETGDEVTLLGFYEGDGFEVGHITDGTNNLSVLIREDGGRPLWAGRGRRGG